MLENIDIQDAGGYIQFSGKADLLVLDILLYPIIQKDIVEKIRKNTFSSPENVTSGLYIYEKHEMEDRTKTEKISFVKNPLSTMKDVYVQKYVFRFFRDKNELLASKDSLNIAYPSGDLTSMPSPRFDNYRFLLPEYISLFLNQEKISPELRAILLGSLSNVTFKSLDRDTGKLLRNPFFTDDTVLPAAPDAKKMETVMKNL